MSNEFSGTGNVGDLPLLKTVMVGKRGTAGRRASGVLRRIPPGRQAAVWSRPVDSGSTSMSGANDMQRRSRSS